MVLSFPYLGMKLTQFWSGIKRTCWRMEGDIDNLKNNVLKIKFWWRLPLHVQTIVISLYIIVILFGTGANLTILVAFCTNKVQSMNDPFRTLDPLYPFLYVESCARSCLPPGMCWLPTWPSQTSSSPPSLLLSTLWTSPSNTGLSGLTW